MLGSNPHTLRAARKPGGNQGNQETMAPWFPGFPPPGFRWSESGVLTVQNHVFGPSQARFETCSKTSGFIGKKVCFSRRKPGVHPPLEAKLATFFGPERGEKLHLETVRFRRLLKEAAKRRAFFCTPLAQNTRHGVHFSGFAPRSRNTVIWGAIFGSSAKHIPLNSGVNLRCFSSTFLGIFCPDHRTSRFCRFHTRF